jgi:hypothetical protein
MADMLAAALDLIHRVPVFPVNPHDKRPLTQHGFKDATNDEAQVRTWWTWWPLAMIGVPMGPRSGMWLFDVDIDPAKGFDGPKELARLTAQYGPLPDTLASTTPRGGSHFYFRWNGVDIRNSTSKIGPGLDVKGDGGYTIVPPSERGDGTPYRWSGNTKDPVEAPQWLIDKALGAPKPKITHQQNATADAATASSPLDQAWALKALEIECAAVSGAPPGTRNDRLNTAAFNLGQIVAAGGLDEEEVCDCLFAAAEDCDLVADDGAQQVRATIDSGMTASKAQPRTRPRRRRLQLIQVSPQQSAQTSPQPQPQSGLQSGPQPGSSGSQSGSQSGSRSGPQPGSQTGSQTAPQPTPSPQPPRALIRLTDGELPRIVDDVETVLIAAGGRDLYQRGELVVRPIKSKLKAANDRDTFGWQLIPVTTPFLVDTFTRIIRFEKWDGRAKDYLPKNCPDQVAEVYLARTGGWKIPVLLGIVNTPFLRADGSLCEQLGYDKASALLFNPEKQAFPSVAANPTLEQARNALKYLDGALLSEFPFVENIDRSVALSGILTAFDRRAMATAPLHGYTSPVAGTGKSLLVDLASILVSGEIAPVISQGKNEEELEKRLGAALIAGDAIVSLDNCDHEVSSSFLCQALTQARLRIRLLGYSRQVEVPINAAFYCTGNNLEISNDLTRRTLLCQIDAGMERPELRSFKRNVLETARNERGHLVAAILTVLRGWHCAGTAIGVEPLGSFEDWSFRVRSPLLWLDRDDPCDSIKAVRASDPQRAGLNTVLVQWKEKLGTASSYTVQQVIQHASRDQDFFGALAAVAMSKQSANISNDRLGRWLGKNNGKIVNRLKLVKSGSAGGYPLWQVEIV